ncbi:MAG: hypothetical protein MJB14_02440 [Spirochaetes bacterium]|nr:hypothetical protein [Spirochaetota bacterium]
MQKKTIIIGAGLGGLITGNLLKKARPQDEVIIYDSNKIPGGFCNGFQKVGKVGEEKVKYTINIPVVTSDFQANEPFDLFLQYLGIENINWKVVDKPFMYYPTDDEPFLFTKNGVTDLLARTPEAERPQAKAFFDHMRKFYNEVFHKANMNPGPIDAIKMLFTLPTTVSTMMANKTYRKHIDDMGIKTPVIREIFSVTEGFMGVEVEKASAVGELLMIQSFLENSLLQPANGHTFQTLSDRLAENFIKLGGQIQYKTMVDSVLFNDKQASGVVINGEEIAADFVVLSVAQDRIEKLVEKGAHIPKIKKFLKKVQKLPYPNSDFYSYYLVEKELFEKRPVYDTILYHIYRKNKGLGGKDWNLFLILPDELYNEKYYCMALLYVEHDQKKIDWWFDLRNTDYQAYEKEKEKYSQLLLNELIESEPLFADQDKIHPVLTMSPASYLDYGSKYPISGLAQTPANFGMTRMKQVLLDNLFISGGASFSAGVWGAMAGGWIGFTQAYQKMTGIKIGNNDVLYKPDLKNLP